MRFLISLFCIVVITFSCFPDVGGQEKDTMLYDRAVAYMDTQRYSEALECFTREMERAEKLEDVKRYNECLGNIASIYGFMGNLDRCLYYQTRVYDEALKNNDRRVLGEILINLVGTYCRRGDVENARKYFNEQLECPLENVQLARYYFLYNQALIAKLEKKYGISDYYHKEALTHARDYLSRKYVVSQFIGLASNSLQSGHPEDALRYALGAMTEAREDSNMLKMRDVARLLENIYMNLGDRDKANEYKKLKKDFTDSIFEQMQFNMAQNKLFRHETSVNERKVESLNQKITTQYRTISISLITILILVTFIVVIKYNLNKLRTAQRLLIKRNEELMRQQEKHGELLMRKYPEFATTHQVLENVAVADDDIANEPDKNEVVQTKSFDIDPNLANDLHDKINLVMQDVTIITSKGFSINRLAELVGSNTRYVSFIINDRYGKNFRSLLNEHRIMEACRRLSDFDNYGSVTLQTIYQDLGYNSPGAFIEAFKKMNGMTPSLYQRRAKAVHDNHDEPE